MPKNRLLPVLFTALALVAAACGGGDDSSTDQGSTDQSSTEDEAATQTTAAAVADNEVAADFPVTIESEGGTWTLESRPERIVSLSPTATEILFAVGAGEQVVAADEYSNYPPEAPATDLSGFDPNVEAIIGYEPDLVVIANDANELVAGLTAVDIPVLVSSAPADIEGGYAAMAELGAATGRVDETAAAAADLRADIEAALAGAPQSTVRLYHELDDTYFSASSFGFVGAVYAELGATNIADEADVDKYGFPQLTEEYIVEANPELIVITDQVAYSADDVAARAGWDQISAVENGNILVVEADTASRWGPRLPQFITAVTDALAGVPAS